LEAILQAGLVLFHGSMEELMDVILHVLEEGSVVRLVFPAGRPIMNRAGSSRRRRRIHWGRGGTGESCLCSFTPAFDNY
jgi:hypothetical protein